MSKGSRFAAGPVLPILIFCVMAIGIGLTGFIFQQRNFDRLREAKGQELAAVADLKVRQIVSWRRERLSDANYIFQSRQIAEQIERISTGHDLASDRQELHDWVSSMFSNGHYEQISVLDTNHNPLSVSPEGNSYKSAEDVSLLAIANRTRSIYFTDFFIDQKNHPALNLAIPILSVHSTDTTIIGGVVLHINPESFFYPFVQSWPIPSRTSEFLIVRRDSNEVVFLNSLRNQQIQPIIFRQPLDNVSLPSVQAVTGKDAIVEGIDYRNIRVLAATQQIPGTNWSVVAKEDYTEIFSSALINTYQVEAIVFLLILAAGISIFWFWKHQRLLLQQQQRKIEHEHATLSQQYEFLTKYAHDIVFLFDQNYHVIEANDRAIAAYGYTRSELLQLTAQDLRSPETRGQIVQLAKQMSVGGHGVNVETMHVRKDGSYFPIEASTRQITIDGVIYYHSVIRDITERKRAETELREAAAHWTTTFNSISDCILLLDNQGTILKCNAAACQLHGLTEDQIIGRKCFELTHDMSTFYPCCPLKKMLQSGKSEKLECPIKDRWYISTADPLFDETGAIIGAVHVIKDITDRKQTEESILIREQDFAKAQQLAHIGSWSWDPDHDEGKWSEEMYRIYGRDPNLGVPTYKESQQLMHPDDWPEFDAAVTKALASKSSYTIESRILRPNGTFRNVLNQGEVQCGEDGSIIRLFGTTLDVTERRRAEESLRESEEHFRLLAESATDVISRHSPAGVYLYVSPSCLHITGYQQEELIGRSAFEFAHPDDLDRVEQSRSQVVGTSVVDLISYRFRKRDGTYIWLESTSHSISNPKTGEVIEIQLTTRDITERMLAEEDRNQMVAILDSTSDLVAVATMDGKLNYMNLAGRRLLGWDKATDILQCSIQDAHPEWAYRIVQDKGIPKALASGTWQGETVIRSLSGVEIPVSQVIMVHVDSAGHPLYMSTIMRDISDRKRSEEALRISNERFELAQKASGVGVWDWNLETNQTTWSTKMFEIFGLDPSEQGASTEMWESVLHPEDRESAIACFNKALEDRSFLSNEYRILRPNGETRWINVMGQGEYDEQGRPIRMIGVNFDITERKTAEESLRAKQIEIQSIFSCAPVGMCEVVNQIFVEVNDHLCSMLGYSRDELIGTDPGLLVLSPADYESASAAFLEQITEFGLATVETRWRCKDQRVIDVILGFAALSDYAVERGVIMTVLDITDRKRAEESIRRSEERFKQVAESAGEWIWETDKDGLFTYCNPSVETILGYAPEEVVGKLHIYDFQIDDDKGSTGQVLTFFSRKEAFKNHQVELLHKGGSPVILDASGTPMLDEKGNLSGYRGVNTNITERKQAEEALRQKEELFRTVFHATPGAISICRIDDTFVDVNESFTRITGYSREELIGRKTVDVGFWTDISDYNRALAILSSGKAVDGLEIKFRVKNGSIIVCQLFSSIVTLSNGPHILAITIDITEQKQAETALKESQRQLSTLMSNLPGIAYRCRNDLKRTMEFISEGCKELTGYLPEDLVANKRVAFSDLIHDKYQDMVWNDYQNVLKDHRTYNGEYPIKTSDGAIKWVWEQGCGIYSPTGEVVAIEGLIVDVTERKRAEEALREQDIRLAKLSAQVPGMIFQFMLKPDGTFSVPFSTDAIHHVFGCSPQDVEHDFGPIANVLYPDDKDKVIQSIMYSAEHLIPWQCEYRVQIPGHPIRWLWGSSIPEKLPDGSIIWHGYNADVTELKAAGEAIRERQARIESIFRGAPVGIGELVDRVFVEVNDFFGTMLGYSLDELLGQNSRLVYYSDEDYDLVGKDLYPLAREHGTASCEVRWRRKDGNPIELILGLTPISSGLSITGYTFTVMDITERKHHEETLRQSLSLLEATLESTADGILAVDLERKVVAYNQRFLELWQIPDMLSISNDDKKLMEYVLDQVKSPQQVRSQTANVYNNPQANSFDVLEFTNGRVFERSSQPQYVGDHVMGRVWSFRDVTARRQAEDSLKHERDLVAKIMDTSPVGIVTTNRAGQITFANHQAERVLGLSQSDLTKRSYNSPEWKSMHYDGSIIPEEELPFRQVMTTGNAVENVHETIQWMDGRQVHLSVNASPIFDETGQVDGMVASVLDVTEQLRSAEELKLSEQRLRSIIDEAPFGAHLYELHPDDELIFIGANAAANRILGLDHDQFIGKSIGDAFPGLMETDIPERYRHIARTGERFQADQVDYDAGGILGAFEVHAFRTEPFRMAVFFRDITERKRAEESLRQSEERFRMIFQTIPDSVTISRVSDGLYVNVNDGFLQTTGFSRDEVIGRTVLDLGIWADPSDRKKFIDLLHQHGMVSNVETIFRTKDGIIHTHLSSARILLFNNEEHILFVAKDIEEIKQSQEALRIKTEELDRFFSINLDLLCIADTEGYFHRVNPEWEHALGYRIEDLEGHRFLDLIHPDDIEATTKALSSLSTGSDLLNFTNRYRCKDGSYRWIEWSSTTYQGKLIYAAARDITERLQADRTLRLRESYLTAIIENQPGLIWLKDVDCRFLAVNHQFSTACGLAKPEDLYGKTDFDVWPHELAEKYRADDLKVMAGREPVAVEEQILEQGEILWFATYKTPIFDDHGTVIGTTGFSTDITERMRFNKELAESQALILAAIEASPAGILIADAPDIRITMANSAALGIRGESRDHLTDIPVEMHPLHWQTFHLDGSTYSGEDLPLSRAILKGETVRDEDLIIRRSDGEDRWVSASAAPVRSLDGEIVAGVVVFPDITERKRAEEAVKLNESRLETLLHLNQTKYASLEEITRFAMEEAVRLTQSTIGYVAFANEDETVLTMYAWSNAAMQECAIQDKPLVYQVKDTGLWGEAVRQRRPVITNDYMAPSPLKKGYPEGHVFISRHMNIPIFDNDKIVIVAGVGNKSEEYDESDVRQLQLLMEGMWQIVQRKRAEDKIKTLNAELEQRVEARTAELEIANKELESFSYSVSHDLRAPLRHIDGYIDLLLRQTAKTPLDEKSIRYLNNVSDSAKRMGVLIDDLLSFSRMGRTELQQKLVHVNELVADIISELSSTTLRKIDWTVSPLPRVRSDYAMLRQVYVNLISNAIKFTQQSDPATIEIGSFENETNEVVFFVRDNGAGFDMKYVDKLFGVFQRLHTEDEFPGTGIGLANVRRIISRHGGRTWAEGEIGKGATFYFTLPVRQ